MLKADPRIRIITSIPRCLRSEDKRPSTMNIPFEQSCKLCGTTWLAVEICLPISLSTIAYAQLLEQPSKEFGKPLPCEELDSRA